MRQASAIVATLREIMSMVEPGQTTGELVAYAERRIREMGATPVSRIPRIPASICASINTRSFTESPTRSG